SRHARRTGKRGLPPQGPRRPVHQQQRHVADDAERAGRQQSHGGARCVRRQERVRRDRTRRLEVRRLVIPPGPAQTAIACHKSPNRFRNSSKLHETREGGRTKSHLCPRGRPFMPYGRAFSLYGRTFVPYGRTFAPYGRAFASYGRTFGPYGRAFAPYGRAFAPYGRTFGPYGRTLT